MRTDNRKNAPYTSDEAFETVIESALVWRKLVRLGQQTGRTPPTLTRAEWIAQFIGWLTEREEIS